MTGESKPQVLIVDDEPGVRRLLQLTLRRAGFDVRSAAGGLEAVELYRQKRADIVLLDVRMPDLDGPHTLGALRQLDPQVRCAFMTGEHSDYSPQKLLACGAVHVLLKPFESLGQLATLMRQLVQ
jgi:CheY-like chemotaxis protein